MAGEGLDIPHDLRLRCLHGGTADASTNIDALASHLALKGSEDEMGPRPQGVQNIESGPVHRLAGQRQGKKRMVEKRGCI
ncbi:hypothetical protein MMC25_007781 [Agyrium rufum]|nr:hypothetical protein [Agyrium rufum]